jgi:4-amino-4-deoxy-L-arabinose transferase-like glycosyltransferase
MSEREISRIAFTGISCALVVYGIGWFNNIMDTDAAQYAAMSLEMLKRADYLTFTDHGKDYLDKPPMIFWLSGLSMSLLGANNFAYRLPAFAATILAFYSTYRFCILFYSRQTGILAVLILATLQATFLINHDVRTDTNLMAFYIFTLWQLAAYLQDHHLKNLVLGFIGIGFAMLSKGPIGMIAPALAIFAHLVLRKEWKSAFNTSWILGIFVTSIVLIPMSYGLYHQFDLQPEKLVNGQRGISGLRFFYWTQSFGRITGESSWDNHAGPFFLSHSTMWAFAPWSLFLILGISDQLKACFLYLKGKASPPEFITLFGFLLPFAALSASRYQLPHYAFLVYPLGAIMTSSYILNVFYARKSIWSQRLYKFQIFLLYLVLVFTFVLVWFPFPNNNLAATLLFAALFASFTGSVVFLKSRNKMIISCTILIIGVNLILNTYFYPNILKYQAGSQLGSLAKEHGATQGNFYSYEAGVPNSLNFYSGILVKETNDLGALTGKTNCFIYTNEENISQFRAARPDLKVIAKNGDFPITMLKGKFLSPKTRPETLKMKVLVQL